MHIYLIYHPDTDRGYVGKTKGTVEARWKQHQADAKHHRGSHEFGQAIRQYGPDAFQVKTLQTLSEADIPEACDMADLLADRENHWIHKQRTLRPMGFNDNSGSGKPAIRSGLGESPNIPESHPPFIKKGASLYIGTKGTERTNETTLGEAHALASLQGSPQAAAAVQYAIAAILDGHDSDTESGYMLIIYRCRYGIHYKGYEKRQWPADRAKGLPEPMHAIARFAIAHQDDIERLYKKCLASKGSPHELVKDQRIAGILDFREEVRVLYRSELLS